MTNTLPNPLARFRKHSVPHKPLHERWGDIDISVPTEGSWNQLDNPHRSGSQFQSQSQSQYSHRSSSSSTTTTSTAKPKSKGSTSNRATYHLTSAAISMPVSSRYHAQRSRKGGHRDGGGDGDEVPLISSSTTTSTSTSTSTSTPSSTSTSTSHVKLHRLSLRPKHSTSTFPPSYAPSSTCTSTSEYPKENDPLQARQLKASRRVSQFAYRPISQDYPTEVRAKSVSPFQYRYIPAGSGSGSGSGLDGHLGTGGVNVNVNVNVDVDGVKERGRGGGSGKGRRDSGCYYSENSSNDRSGQRRSRLTEHMRVDVYDTRSSSAVRGVGRYFTRDMVPDKEDIYG
ncbi:hypothetical protein BO70DRAFT_423169 [Aspergillus heteromorphus CBS 117.55]|uniref:Uncharacterized protein n=1 Tax=Aspergillus heteromorphus CBS 117.55 TaxID=1448321 RepID=A0A317WHT7_9EURO|nr:uncharacterized protein BO70DRAFT_423169 [Aspergillus heteromorphus CBS 117.55]PWY86016.1 hypothetical protein BO70DRAFT_423169 [Aspergillus heteromorphus CBS 117.55]